MAEEQGNGQQEPQNPERTFTQDEVNRLIGKERQKYKGFAEYKKAAEELEQLKASQMSEAERMQKELDEANAKLSELQAERDRASWVAEASSATGVPEDLLSLVAASSKEELAEKAATLADRYGKQQSQTVPVVLGDGTHAPKPKDEPADASDFFRGIYSNLHR